MRGSGTKLAITSDNPPARLLDLTRLLRRAGQVLTGVDRVELAYLQALSAGGVPCWGIARTSLGYVLLPPDALPGFARCVGGLEPWPSPQGLSRLSVRLSAQRKGALTYLRRFAAGRCTPRGLSAMLVRHLPANTDYFNVGHSNLTQRMLTAIDARCGRTLIFVHDVIPKDFPDFQRPGVADAFEAKMRQARAHADAIIVNSADTGARLVEMMTPWGPPPWIIVSHLGTDVPQPDPGGLPQHLLPDTPYFLCLGTIEPRKNHALLLDIWEGWGAQAPRLVIAGRRGWRNEAVFARLDALREGSPVIEAPNLSDGAVAALMQGAHALLLPSFAEGFGLPAVEAAALGTPVIASDLPALREVLGNIPVYASPHDRYAWEKAIQDHALRKRQSRGFTPPTWADHVKTVLSQL